MSLAIYKRFKRLVENVSTDMTSSEYSEYMELLDIAEKDLFTEEQWKEIKEMSNYLMPLSLDYIAKNNVN